MLAYIHIGVNYSGLESISTPPSRYHQGDKPILPLYLDMSYTITEANLYTTYLL